MKLFKPCSGKCLPPENIGIRSRFSCFQISSSTLSGLGKAFSVFMAQIIKVFGNPGSVFTVLKPFPISNLFPTSPVSKLFLGRSYQNWSSCCFQLYCNGMKFVFTICRQLCKLSSFISSMKLLFFLFSQLMQYK